MSLPDSGSAKGSVKTLAIRLEPELHAQLSLIAQLRGTTITDEIRAALEAHVTAARQTPDLLAQADEARASLQREFLAREAALAAMFGTNEQPESKPDRPAARGRSSTDGKTVRPE